MLWEKKMKRFPVIFLIAILAILSLACSITINAPDIKTGHRTAQVETLNINEAAPIAPAKLTVGMGAGKLGITSGGEGLVSGTVRYNVVELKPEITHSGSEITIKQNTNNFASAIGSDVVNDWNLKLGNTPMDLTVNAGAYEGTVDLSGVPLTRLQINDGASKAQVVFHQPNPQIMENLIYKTGASTVDLIGLANANFQNMTFGGGAGAYTLDFTGKLQREANVNITSGVSSIKIIIPTGTHARINLTGGLNNVNQTGSWNVNNHVYETGSEGPILSISIDMGVGNLELVNQ
jgi:hypothetical protein